MDQQQERSSSPRELPPPNGAPAPPQQQGLMPPDAPPVVEQVVDFTQEEADLREAAQGSFQSSSRKSSKRTDALYQHAKLRDAKLEEKRKSAAKETTFQPQFSTTKSPMKPIGSFEERQRLAALKQQERNARGPPPDQNSTFRPDLSPTAHINEKVRTLFRESEEGNVPVHEALHRRSFERLSSSEKKKTFVDKECTFKPQLQADKSIASMAVQDKLKTSVFDRLYDREKQKAKRDALHSQSLKNQGCTFQPDLPTKAYTRPTAAAAADGAGRPAGAAGPVHHRLYASHQQTQEKLQGKRASQAAAVAAEHPFRPRIKPAPAAARPGAPPSPAAAAAAAAASPVGHRLHAGAGARQAKLEALRASLQDAELTFRPRLNAPRDPEVQAEADRLEALYQRGLHKQRSRGPPVGVKAAPGSAPLRKDARVHGVAEDANAALRAQQEARDLREHCTFRPQLVARRSPAAAR
eukprot:CAMPEP_0194578766 /NCGR_PEP_ID=MMETSP0292-20121207/13070_1 /TAXON_ID=39354 /ORGANISM="Heterosigma akashiwo, Strain CCMP2393" /LENGTH=466 /DNA_ID=CAMNT_0039431521 /DNA_START=41 /DNA_END=1438 /DNA_ORIENTATION=+